MGEEHRGSSGGGVAMLVVAILGGLLIVGCLGGVLVLAGGWFYARSAAEDMQMQAMEAQDRVRLDMERANREVQEAHEKIRQEVEGIKLPEVAPHATPPETTPVPGSPGEEAKKE